MSYHARVCIVRIRRNGRTLTCEPDNLGCSLLKFRPYESIAVLSCHSFGLMRRGRLKEISGDLDPSGPIK